MTFEQLQYFRSICTHGSFFKAALESNISQSALSKQIAKLEQELEIYLFDRSHRTISLTQAGEQFLKDTECMLTMYQHMLDHLCDYKDKDASTLKIAMLPIFYQYNLVDIFHQFTNAYPNIQLQIDEIEEFDVTASVQSNTYDMYILRGEYEMSRSFQRSTLFQDTLAVAIHQENPLSNEKEISIQQVANEQILLTPKHTMISKLALQACIEAGFQPNILRQGRLESILPFVKTNQGIAFVMKNTLPFFKLENVRVIPLKENIHADIQCYYTLHKKKEAVHCFLSYMQKQI